MADKMVITGVMGTTGDGLDEGASQANRRGRHTWLGMMRLEWAEAGGGLNEGEKSEFQTVPAFHPCFIFLKE